MHFWGELYEFSKETNYDLSYILSVENYTYVDRVKVWPYIPQIVHRKNLLFFVVKGPAADTTDAPQSWGLLCNPVMKMVIFFVFPSYGAPVEWNWQGKTVVIREKRIPVPLCVPHIPHGLTPGSNSALRGERPATNRLSHGTAKIVLSQ
jgi:hypothetical protein